MRLFCLLINISHLAWTTLSGIKSRCYLRPGGQWSASTERWDSKDFLSRSFQFPSRREMVDSVVKQLKRILRGETILSVTKEKHIMTTSLFKTDTPCCIEYRLQLGIITWNYLIQKWPFFKNEFENVGILQKCESIYIKLEKIWK